jgi:hypothetical protein
MERQPRRGVVGGSVLATCIGSGVYVDVPFARLRHDVRWHRSTVPYSVCAPWCFLEVLLESAQHGSSTCPPSSASAPPMSSHSWSHADGGSHGLASSLSTPGSTRGRRTLATFSRTSTSSLHAAFLDMDAERFKVDLQHCISFHGAVLCIITSSRPPLLKRPSWTLTQPGSG